MIRVLIAEDSATVREMLVAILSADPEIEVVGEARDGVEAVELTHARRPDVVTMDIHMPNLDGFEATRRIMAEVPTPIVIVSGTVDVREVEISMHALRIGALTLLPKPPSPLAPEFDELARRYVQTVKAMARVKVVRVRGDATTPPRPGPPDAGTAAARTRGAPRIVAIAASTGGPAALGRVLGGLPASFALPIVVVQHIADGFVRGLATWLETTTSLHVVVARDGERLAPRSVYLAPDGHHLRVAPGATIAVARGPAIGGLRPSADALFESVAQVYRRAVVAVILTGMGRDGVDGLTAIRAAGGVVIAQDEATSVVYGMPGSAVAAGVADEVLPLDAIAARIDALASSKEDQR